MALGKSMAVSDDNIAVRVSGAALCCRIQGRVGMRSSPAFNRWVAERLEGARQLEVDMRDCVQVDSTFVGTLLLLKRNLAKEGKRGPVLISPSKNCKRLLQEMGVDDEFEVIETAEPIDGKEWAVLPEGSPEMERLQKQIVHAHEALGSLPGPTGKTFSELARMLSKDAAPAEGRRDADGEQPQ